MFKSNNNDNKLCVLLRATIPLRFIESDNTLAFYCVDDNHHLKGSNDERLKRDTNMRAKVQAFDTQSIES